MEVVLEVWSATACQYTSSDMNGRQRALRDDTGHDTLVISEEKNTQRYKHTGEVTARGSAWSFVSRGSYVLHELLAVQPVHTGRTIVWCHDSAE